MKVQDAAGDSASFGFKDDKIALQLGMSAAALELLGKAVIVESPLSLPGEPPRSACNISGTKRRPAIEHCLASGAMKVLRNRMI